MTSKRGVILVLWLEYIEILNIKEILNFTGVFVDRSFIENFKILQQDPTKISQNTCLLTLFHVHLIISSSSTSFLIQNFLIYTGFIIECIKKYNCMP